jgi:hypothetical protein
MWFSPMREWPSESLQGSRQRKNSININFTLPISAREGRKRTDWLFSSRSVLGFEIYLPVKEFSIPSATPAKAKIPS